MSFQIIDKWTANEADLDERPYSLSVVVPVLNEEENILRFITTVDEVLLASTGDRNLLALEYLFVNDGSNDRTEYVIRQLARHDRRVRLINLSRNFGKEAALCAGLRHASGDAVVPMDVDMQDPPELLPELIAQWRGGAKVVNAKRVDRTSDTWLKRWTSALFYRLINWVSDYDVPSNVGDFRLLDRDAIAVLNELTEHSRFNKGLFSWIGFEVATVEYARPARVAGTTKWRPAKLIGLAVDGIVSSTTLPLRVWTIVGALIAAGAFGYALFLIVSTMINGIDVPGYASLMVVTLALGGLNLVSLGLMGEYVGRVAVQVRGRPLYVVGSTVGVDTDQ